MNIQKKTTKKAAPKPKAKAAPKAAKVSHAQIDAGFGMLPVRVIDARDSRY